ncbi:tetratricopeptide repeat protein [Plantactinospora sp. S1510]|uniref:Tetratricopeptide repeat protein n=1 Tax=Plantactinospora alkalitolerans TaxID=2789879 RepID=A0ABS0GQQ3_9ACTN|nr:tetratricopeptide repeat protein [Plantactinospora alkalitolerans]MBF9128334.1 tetratricopeptide repeat protein [Plantactinospora alkalitolerans]
MLQTPHRWIRARHGHDRRRELAAGASGPLLASLDAHRRRRGPYTAAGDLLRTLVPEARKSWPELVSRHEVEILTLAPELGDLVPAIRHAPAEPVPPEERIRVHPRPGTLRFAHGLVEFLHAYLDRLGGGRRDLLIDNLHEADPTDQELCVVLLRRADRRLLRLHLATGTEPIGDPLGPLDVSLPAALHRYAVPVRVTATELPELPALPKPPTLPGTEPATVDDPAVDECLARRFVATDGTDDDPRVREAYQRLSPERRAGLHDERAARLSGPGDWSPGLGLGALAYHAEHGGDPAGAGAEALLNALDHCVDRGFHHAAVDCGRRGRAVVDWAGQPERSWAFVDRMTISLAELGLPEEALGLYQEARAYSSSPVVHLGAAYGIAVLHIRYLSEGGRGHHAARGWANQAVALARCLPDPVTRAVETVFHQNGLASVAVHEGRLDEALLLVGAGLDRLDLLDRELGAAGHVWLRSMLRHHRAQVLLALGRYDDALSDVEAVIAADPDRPEYHVDRGDLLRRLGHPAEAIVSYGRAMDLSAPVPQTYHHRGEARLVVGDVAGAEADFGYVLELDESQLDAYVNRAVLRYDLGDTDGAWQDVDHGLALEPDSPRLLCVRAQLLMAEDPGAGEAALTELVGAHPLFPDGWAARGVAGYERGDLTAAVADFDRALALADTPATRLRRGMALVEADRCEEALADFTEVHAATADPAARRQIGICLDRLGRATVRAG